MYKLTNSGDEPIYDKFITHLTKEEIAAGFHVINRELERRTFRLQLYLGGGSINADKLGGLQFEMDMGVDDWPIGQVTYKTMSFSVGNNSADIEDGMATGQIVRPSIGLDVPNGDTGEGVRTIWVPYGVYAVDSVAKDMSVKTYSCYDRLYYLNDKDCDFGGETYSETTTVGYVLNKLTSQYEDIITLSDSHKGDFEPWWDDVLQKPKKYEDYVAPPEEEEEDELIIDDIPPIEDTFPEDSGQQPDINPGKCCDCTPSEGTPGISEPDLSEADIVLETFQYFPLAEIVDTGGRENIYWESSDSDIADVNPSTGVVFAYGLGIATVRCCTSAGVIAVCNVGVCKTSVTMDSGIEYTLVKDITDSAKWYYWGIYQNYSKPVINGVTGGHILIDYDEGNPEAWKSIPTDTIVESLNTDIFENKNSSYVSKRVGTTSCINKFIKKITSKTNIEYSINVKIDVIAGSKTKSFQCSPNKITNLSSRYSYQISITNKDKMNVEVLDYDPKFISDVKFSNDGQIRTATIYPVENVTGSTVITFTNGTETDTLNMVFVGDGVAEQVEAVYRLSSNSTSTRNAGSMARTTFGLRDNNVIDEETSLKDLVRMFDYDAPKMAEALKEMDNSNYYAGAIAEELDTEEAVSYSLMNRTRNLTNPTYDSEGNLIATYAEEPDPSDPTQTPNENGQVLSTAEEEIGFEMTEIQMLGYIAGYCGGNMALDHEGELRLLRLVESEKESENLYDKYIPANQVAVPEIDNCDASSTLGGLIIHTSTYEGDDIKLGNEKPTQTKYVLEIDNPFMTKERASEIFSEMSSLTYYPMRVTFLSDPRLWLGDLLYFEGYRQLNEITGTNVEVVREGYYPVMKLISYFDGAPSLEIEASCSSLSDRTNSYTGTLSDKIDEVSNKVDETNENVKQMKYEMEEIRALVGYINELFAIEVSAENIVSATISTKNIRIAPTRKGTEGGIYIDGDSIDFLDDDGVQRLHLGSSGDPNDYYIRFLNENGYTRELRALDPGPDCCTHDETIIPETKIEEIEILEGDIVIPQFQAVPMAFFIEDWEDVPEGTYRVDCKEGHIKLYDYYNGTLLDTDDNKTTYVGALSEGPCVMDIYKDEVLYKTYSIYVIPADLIARPVSTDQTITFKMIEGQPLSHLPIIDFYIEKPDRLRFGDFETRHLLFDNISTNKENDYISYGQEDYAQDMGFPGYYGFGETTKLSLERLITKIETSNSSILSTTYEQDDYIKPNKDILRDEDLQNKYYFERNVKHEGTEGDVTLTVSWRVFVTLYDDSGNDIIKEFHADFTMPINVTYTEVPAEGLGVTPYKQTVCENGIICAGSHEYYNYNTYHDYSQNVEFSGYNLLTSQKTLIKNYSWDDVQVLRISTRHCANAGTSIDSFLLFNQSAYDGSYNQYKISPLLKYSFADEHNADNLALYNEGIRTGLGTDIVTVTYVHENWRTNNISKASTNVTVVDKDNYPYYSLNRFSEVDW